MKFEIPQNATARDVLEAINQWSAEFKGAWYGDDSHPRFLWDIMSALRGPDRYGDSQAKHDFTMHLRGLVARPLTHKVEFMYWDHPDSPQALIERLELIEEEHRQYTVEQEKLPPSERKPFWMDEHFMGHMKAALLAARQLGYGEPEEATALAQEVKEELKQQPGAGS